MVRWRGSPAEKKVIIARRLVLELAKESIEIQPQQLADFFDGKVRLDQPGTPSSERIEPDVRRIARYNGLELDTPLNLPKYLTLAAVVVCVFGLLSVVRGIVLPIDPWNIIEVGAVLLLVAVGALALEM